jgi:hypothetical protein
MLPPLLALAVFLALVPTTGAGATAGRADLRITVWGDGRPGPSRTWTLRCDPVGGTLPERGRACRVLASMRNPFRPVPKDAICTEIYGGPQEAFVRGTFRGRRIWTWFNRRNGCHIARWDRHRVLFAGAGGDT